MMQRLVRLDEEHPLVLGVLVPPIAFMMISSIFGRPGIWRDPIALGIFVTGWAVIVVLALTFPEYIRKRALFPLGFALMLLDFILVFSIPYIENLELSLIWLYRISTFVMTSVVPIWLFRKDVGRFFTEASMNDWKIVIISILMLEVGAFVYFFQEYPFFIRIPLTLVGGFGGFLVILIAFRPLFNSNKDFYEIGALYFGISLMFLFGTILYRDWDLQTLFSNEGLIYHLIISFPFVIAAEFESKLN